MSAHDVVRKEALYDTAIRVASDTVLGRTCRCGCLIGNRNTEYSAKGCNGHRSTGDPDLGSLFCFQPGPFTTYLGRASQYHVGIAVVWLSVWRLHRGFFPCPRICLWGRQTASHACLALGDRCFLDTQSDWIHPLLCVPRTSPWPSQFMSQAYSRGVRSILLTVRMLAESSRRRARSAHLLQDNDRGRWFRGHRRCTLVGRRGAEHRFGRYSL